jgi:hypothetical protein
MAVESWASVGVAAFDAAAPAGPLTIHEQVMATMPRPRPTYAQLRFMRALARLVELNGHPMRLGNVLIAVGNPVTQQRTVDACVHRGWVVMHEGPPKTWDLTDAGRAEVAS